MPSYKELKLKQLKKKYETQYGVSQQDADLQASRDISQQEEENDKGNVWQQIIGGIGDISNNFAKGFFGLFEGIIDAGAGFVGLFGDDEFKKGVQDFQNIDIADNIVKGANLINPGTQINNLITTGKWYDPFDFDNDNETNDVTEKSFVNNFSETGQSFTRGLAQALGQVTGQILTVGTAGSLGASANVAKGIGMGVLGASSFGSGMTQANQEGASFGESFGYGLLNAGKEMATEALVGKAVSGITGVPSAVGGALAKGEQVGSSIFSRFQNKAIKSFANEGAKKFLKQIVSEFTEEGLEEAVGSLIEPVLQKVTYKKDKSVSEIFEENGGWGGVLEDFLVGGISGGIAGGVQTGAEVRAVGKQLGSTTVKGNFEAYGVQDAIAKICDIDEQLGIELLKIKGGLNENIDLDVLKDVNSVRDFVEKYTKEQGKFTKEGDINSEAKKIADLIKQRENIQKKFTNAFEEYAKQKGLELDNMADANGNVEVNDTTLGKLRAIDTKNQFNERATATKETLVKEGVQKVFGDKVNVEFGNSNNFNSSNNTITLNKNSNDSVAKLLASLGHESEHKFGTKKFRTQMLKAIGITETQLNDMANKYALRKGRDSSGKFTNYEKLFKEYAKSNNIKEGTQEYSDVRKEYFKDEIVADLLGVYVSNNIDELQRSIKRSDAGLLKRGIMNIQDLFKGHEARQFRKAMNYFAEGIKEDTKAQNKAKKEAQKNIQTNTNIKPAMAYSLDEEEKNERNSKLYNKQEDERYYSDEWFKISKEDLHYWAKQGNNPIRLGLQYTPKGWGVSFYDGIKKNTRSIQEAEKIIKIFSGDESIFSKNNNSRKNLLLYVNTLVSLDKNYYSVLYNNGAIKDEFLTPEMLMLKDEYKKMNGNIIAFALYNDKNDPDTQAFYLNSKKSIAFYMRNLSYNSVLDKTKSILNVIRHERAHFFQEHEYSLYKTFEKNIFNLLVNNANLYNDLVNDDPHGDDYYKEALTAFSSGIGASDYAYKINKFREKYGIPPYKDGERIEIDKLAQEYNEHMIVDEILADTYSMQDRVINIYEKHGISRETIIKFVKNFRNELNNKYKTELNNKEMKYSLDDDASNTIEKEDELLEAINELEKFKKTKEYSNLSFNEKENKKINKVGLTKYLTDAEKEPFMKEMKLGKETRKLFDANKAGDWILEQLKDKIAEKNGEIVLVEQPKPKAEVKPVVEEKPAETTKPETTTVETTVEVKPEVQNAEKVTAKDLEVDIKNKPNEDILKSKITVTQATKFIQNIEQAINQELLNIENQEARMYEFTTLDDYSQFEKRGNSIQNSFKRIEEYRKLANKVKNSLIKTTTQQSKFEDTMDDFTRKNKYQGFDDDEYWNKRSKNFNKKFEKQKEVNKNTDFNAVSADLVSKQFIKDEFEKLVNQNNRLPQSDEATILKRKIREELNDYNKSKEEKVKKMLEKLSKYYNDVRDNLSGLTDTKKRLQNDLDRVVSTLTEEQLNNDKVKEKIDGIKQKIDNLSSSEVVKVTEDKNGKLRSSVETMYDRELAIRAEITGNAFVKKSDLTNEETYTQTGNGLTDIADKAKPKEASTNDNLLSIVEDYELDEVFQDGSTEDNHLAYNIYKVESYLDEDGVYSLSSITNADGREKKSIKSFHKNIVSMFKNIQKGFNKVVGYIDESISNFEYGSEEDIKYYLDLVQSMADSEFLDEEYIDNAVDFIENYNTELKEAQDFLKSKEVSKAIEDKDLTKLNELLSKNKYFKDKSFSETADAKTFIEKVLNMETINEGRYDFTSCYDIIAEITEYAETNDFKSKHIQELIENKKRIVETEKSKKKVEKVKKNEVKEPKVDGEAVVEKVNLEPNNAETKETAKDVKPEEVEKPKTEKKPKETKPKAEKPKKKKVSGYYVDENTTRRYYEKDRVATETANTIKNWAEVHKKVVYNQNAGEAIVNLTYSVINKKGDVVRFVFNNRKLGTNGVEFVMLDILKVLNEYQVEGDVSNEAKIDQIYEILKEGVEVITLVPQFDSKGKLKGQYETFTKLDENIEKEEYVQKILTTLRSSIAEIVNNASKPTILVTKLNQLSEKYNADLDKLLTKVDERLKAENELNEKIYKLEKQVIKGEINEKNLEKEIEKLNKELDKVSKQNENYEKLKAKFQKISEELRKKYRDIAKINRTLQRNLARSQRNNTTLRTTLYGEKVIKGNFDKFISKDLVSEFFDASDVDVENYDQIALYVSRGEFDTASQLYAESLNIKLDDEYYKVSDILSDETYTEFITYTKEAFEEFAKNSPQSALSMWKEKYSKLKENYKSKYKDLKTVAKISNQLRNKFNHLNSLVYTKGSGTQSPVLTQFRALVQMLSNPTVNKLYNGKIRAEFKKFYNILQANAKTMQIEVPEILTSLFEDVINNENSATLEEIEKYTNLVDGIADYIKRSFTDKNYTLIDDNGNEVKKKGSEITIETIQQQKNLGKEKFNGVLYNTSDPRVFIQHIDGGNKEGFFHRMYNRFFKGQYVDKVNYWRKLVLPYNEFKNNNKKFIKSLGQNISITIGGKDIEITKGEALYLAEILTDDDAVKHSIKVTGGIEINSEIYKIDEAELDTFKENLNKKLNLDKDGVESQYIKIIDNKLKEAGQIKYVTDVENYGFSNVSVLTDEDGNPIDSNGNIIEDLKNNYDKLVLTKKYFPMIVSDLSLSQNLSNGRAMQQVVAKAKQFRFNYDRTSYNGALRLADVDDIISNHLEQMTTYGALSGVIIDFNNIYNHKMSGDVNNNIGIGDSIGSVTKARFGQNKNGRFYVDDFLKGWTSDIQGMSRVSDTIADSKIKKLISGVRSRFAKFALLANIKVAMTQTASYFGALKYVNAKYLAQAPFALLSNLAPLPAYYQFRNKTNTVSSAYTLSDSVNGALDKLGILINKADALTVKTIWKAICLQEGITKDTDVNSDKYKKAEALWLKTVAETQPMYDSFSRSRMLNTTSELAKMFLMFQTQNNKNWSNIVEMITNKVGGKQIVRTTAGISLAMLAFAFMSEFFKHFIRDDDDDNEFFDTDLLAQGLNSIIGAIPVVGSQIQLNFNNGFPFELNEMSIGALTNINKVIENGNNLFTNGFGSLSPKDYIDTVGMLSGVPTNNIWNLYNDIVRITAQTTKNQSIADFYANQNVAYKGYAMTNKKKVSEEEVKGNKTLSKAYYKIWSNKIMPLEDKTIDVLYDLYKKGVDVNYKTIPNSYKNEYNEDVAIDKKAFQKTYKGAGEKINQLQSSIRFSRLNDNQKVKAISKIFDTYYNLAKKKQTGEKLKLIEALADSNYNLSNTISYLVMIDDLQATKTKTRKEVVQKYINRISTTSQNKYIIYMLSGYKVPDSKKRMVMNYLRRYLPLSYIKDLLEG